MASTVTRQSHREWYETITALRAELAAYPANLELAVRVWDLLSGATGFDVRTGRLAIDTFRASALRSDAGVSMLVSTFRRLADETGEYPRAALFDPPLENLLRVRARDKTATDHDEIQWLLDCIDEDS